MADPFLGEIRCVGFNFAPQGWARCSGQAMSITQNSALFALLGVTYGGDGVTTFNLPNLSTRIPMGYSNGAPPNRQPTELGSVSYYKIPTSTIPANTIKIVLDNP